LRDREVGRTASDLIPGSLKRSKSYSSDLEHLTGRQLEDLAKAGNMRARKMVKLIQEVARLLEKSRGRS
jgi:hypothetical protein